MAEAADNASCLSATESDLDTAILTPKDLPNVLTRQIVLRPEFTLNVYGESGSGLYDGSQTPVAIPVRNSVDSTVTDLLVAVKELTKKVNDQQDNITALGKLVADQQSKITALETRARQKPPPVQIVDCGTWKKATGVQPWNSAHEEAYIKFSKKFKTAPKVTVALNLADVGHDRNLRVKVYVTDVDTSGFWAHADLWGDTRMYACGVTWIAVGTEA